jgi:cobalt-zinc-cadmium efflux system membrane fusion protein
MRTIVSACLLTAFLLGMTTGCKSKTADAADFHPPPGESWIPKTQLDRANIQVEEVSERDVATALVASARLTFHDAHVTHVFTPVTGRVVRIEAQLGQTVKKGDPLVTIQSPDIGQASSDYGKAEADLTAAQHDRDRKRDLYNAHAGSQAELEAADDNYGKAKAELDRAKQKAALLRAGTVDTVSQTYVLRSLIDGEVLMRNVNPGIEVQGQYSGGTGLELFTIGTLDPIWALADIYEVDLARVKAGATIRLSVVTYPDKVFEGKVDWISEMLDPVTRTARVRCTLPNPEHLLKPEMFATASITTSGKKTLAVRRDAVVRLGEQDMVMVESGMSPNGQAIFRRRPVRVDMSEPGEFVPVLNGLTAGEHVVVKNAILLST